MNSDDMNTQTPVPDEEPPRTPDPASGKPQQPAGQPPPQQPAGQPPPGVVPPATPPAAARVPAESPPPRRSKRWWIAGAAALVVLVGVGVGAYAIGESDDDAAPHAVTNGHLGHGATGQGDGNVPPHYSVTGPATPSPGVTDMRIGDGTDVVRIGHVYDNHADLDIEDQSGDGRSVRIESVRTSIASGFVVITTRDGTVVGTAPVSPSAQPVTVTLSTPITGAGKHELVGTLWADNGDGTFDWKADSVVVERDGDRDDDDDYDDHGRNGHGHDEWVDEDFDYWVK